LIGMSGGGTRTGSLGISGGIGFGSGMSCFMSRQRAP
jgi:hypothetical protein